MLPLLLVLSPLVQLAEAAPTNTTSESPAYDATACSYRSVWTILATCALTMLVCVWNATYPNIVRTEKWYTVALHRGVLGVVTLLFPEFTTARAVLEWSPDEICNVSDQKWTRTHGFFALMGGFVVQKDGEEKTVRTIRGLQCLKLKGGTIGVHPTRKQINDRSKSDGLGNVILVLQLLWFVLQVIARGSNHIAITLLEIDTLALAVLSLPLFFFWYSKPMAAAYPHVFYWKDVQKASSYVTRFFLHVMQRSSPDGASDGQTLLWEVISFQYWRNEIGGKGLDVDDGNSLDVKLPPETTNDGMETCMVVMLIVWVIFGGLHLIAWDFQFPSQAERIIWCVASLTLITSPCILSLCTVLEKAVGRAVFPQNIWRYLVSFGIVARLALLITMLASLRDLPASAYQTVSWTSYAPHL
ncbi:hypothetical protein PAXINDRAFT_120512 [Paxillus involutus ATCC 200175]|uniref:Uncharacterized protein n=1 Tax=Paxillus involutus ATCC 200175 TaxID=664439 RepID=A0A0C9SYI4_PAXIN|nr:hypothetical protein PAXINDRAFT_120512 [Paxillus involutus ATCC 200175]